MAGLTIQLVTRFVASIVGIMGYTRVLQAILILLIA